METGYLDMDAMAGKKAVTVADLINAAFTHRLPDTFSIELVGEFGRAGLERTNSMDNEQPCTQLFGDWNAPLGSTSVRVTIRDEDGSHFPAGEFPMYLLATLMAACGRKLWRKEQESPEYTALYAPPRYAPETEVERFHLWSTSNRLQPRECEVQAPA